MAGTEQRPGLILRAAEASSPADRLVTKAEKNLAVARKWEIARVDPAEGEEAAERVSKGLERFFAWDLENRRISAQIFGENYQTYVPYINNYTGTGVGGAACSDGRIYNGAIFDPLVGVLDKRPQGMFATKISGSDGTPVLKDHSIPSAITADVKLFDLKRRNIEANNERFKNMEIFGQTVRDITSVIREALEEEEAENPFAFRPAPLKPKEHAVYQTRTEQKPQIVEFPGPHIDSVHPVHGCGAAKAKGTADGTSEETAMKIGGINLYFDELGEGFDAYNNNIRKAGGKGATFDMVHDSHSQGLIYGLRDAYLNGSLSAVDSPEELRPTLEDLHFSGKIMMTELLDQQFSSKIDRVKRRLRDQLGLPVELDLTNTDDFADSMMLTGLIAKGITEKYEDADPEFSWIPGQMKEDKSQEAVRTLAYTSVRNSAYRNLSNIVPGEHDLVEHPEQLVRAGSTGAPLNVNTKAFIHVTPQGRFTRADRGEIKKLKGLADKFMPELPGDLKADFEKEALVIVAMGKFDDTKYKIYDTDDENTRIEKIIERTKAFEVETSAVRGNASDLRDIYRNEVRAGRVVVVAAIANKRREITHVISSDAANDNVDE